MKQLLLPNYMGIYISAFVYVRPTAEFQILPPPIQIAASGVQIRPENLGLMMRGPRTRDTA